MHGMATDFAFAMKICKELLNGDTKSFEELYSCYHKRFYHFARKRLQSRPDLVNEVLQQFYISLFRNPNIFCNFKDEKRSLYNYLVCRLNWRIKDAFREQGRIERRDEAPIYEKRLEQKEWMERKCIRKGVAKDDQLADQNPEKLVLAKERERMLREALLALAKTHPMDAQYIRMRIFEEMTYKDIAMTELGTGADENEITKRVNAIKTRVTRKNTGSFARFRILLEKKGFVFSDIMKPGREKK